ncbi:MAG: N(5),N(10)-methenyltetrahydromethanopterin cyclohydrolase [Promethearchaeota archaeon CR_4]|nr:MAG: N(5),N(10)-methenyltetrahydromethanopterin cyclohydrolase [Candidatus Lokiarchaeota archaeon CR_4]
MTTISVNKAVQPLITTILSNAQNLGVQVSTCGNGSVIVDGSKGSYEFGRLMGEVCLGGLGSVQFTPILVGNIQLPGVQVTTSHPILACMASQYAGWNVKLKKEGEKKPVFSCMSSGPARALARVEKELFEKLKYEDTCDKATIVFETAALPPEEVMAYVADKCKVAPENLVALCAPTASVPGSVQIAARIVETSIHKLLELHLKPEFIKYGYGTTTIAPVAKNDLIAMGRTNDSLIASGRVYLTIDVPKEEEDAVKGILAKAPANTSKSYGKPFYTTFKEVNFDFFKIDPGVFAPAVITMNNLQTGNVFSAGVINETMLKESYGM